MFICSVNFVGMLKDTLVGSLSIFWSQGWLSTSPAPNIELFHQMQNASSLSLWHCPKHPWGFYAASIKGVIPSSRQRSAYAKSFALHIHNIFFLVISWTFQWPAEMLPEKMGRFWALDPFVPMHPRKLALPTTLQPVRSALGYMGSSGTCSDPSLGYSEHQHLRHWRLPLTQQRLHNEVRWGLPGQTSDGSRNSESDMVWWSMVKPWNKKK